MLLWRPVAGIAGDALAATNLPVVVRKTVSIRQSPDQQLPSRSRNTTPQSKFYFGSRVESVTTVVAPQNPYEPNYTSVLRSYHKAIIGFRLALTARAYLFVGVGMAVADDLLERGLGQNISITAAQIQNALGMQTEYGLGWDF
ncbi:MAG: hypothetical protein NT011_02350 [Kiritimatiellaeota bacterium]|nr:hypothetical protein [Kiritimatiellota bacterium]